MGISPYSAFWNNPIRYNDPDGRCPDCLTDEVGNALATDILSVKNSLYSLFTRPIGYEATFVKNERGNYETGFVPTGGGFWNQTGLYALDALNVGTFGRGGGATGGVFAKTLGATSIINAAKEIGGQFVRVNHSMSKRAAQYEKQITGTSGLDFELKTVKFDGFDGKTLLEAKGEGYAKWVGKDGKFIGIFKGADGLINQAQSQLEAAGGKVPIIWHIAEEKATGAIQSLFKDAKITGIEIKHTPLEK